MTRRSRHVAASLAVLAAYLLFWPVGIEPVAWDPPPSPGFTGPYAASDALAATKRLPLGGGVGPETVALGPDGLLYTGLRDGRIVRLRPDGTGEAETFVDTGGSPGGIQFDADGDLIVVDADRGLLSIAPDGEIVVLADQVDGKRMLFVDDLDIGSDGTIWFTDGSQRFPEHHDAQEFLEGRPTGRLLSYDPRTGETQVRLDGLRFANGVALGPDEAFVLVNETLGYRTTRLWLAGPRAGESEIFLDGYPALPDNVTYNGRDLFWIGFFLPRDPLLDWLRGQGAFLKKFLLRLPSPLLDAVGRPDLRGFVLAVDVDGNVVHNLQDTTGHYGATTSVLEVDGQLYLGSIRMPAVGRIAVPAIR